ncbi:exodeoxyribonuclease VII large subunit [Desulfovibrio sp. OttesenSCG-928-C14]|nr:exodeoxyribonuclease VII large subunit [Desulfovibrio sp. OttesenSCG-928-C14]
MNAIRTVSELTRQLKGSLEAAFPFVWVRGQISNLSRPSSGHIYFSLKDDEASVAAVWFKRSQSACESFDPLTGEVFADGPRQSPAAGLENGQEVICAGPLTVYPARGVYQILVEIVQDAGKGRLQLEFELMKAELARLGYFDPLRKRPLPLNPRRVALVTSPSGAALHDFIRVAQGRGLGAELRLYPAPVQGEAAPERLAAALARANSDNWAEVIVLIRGGGSLEDLWAFNTRPVTDAVYASALPVLCGVGHEVDVSLADLVADLRAATPSHAAQLLWSERREFVQAVDDLDLRLGAAARYRLEGAARALSVLEKNLRLLSPARTMRQKLEKGELAVKLFQARLQAAQARILERESARISGNELLLARLPARLEAALRQKLEKASSSLDKLALRLEGLDPELPLRRGYALVRDASGRVVRSKKNVQPGDALDLYLVDGRLPVVVSDPPE